MIAHESDENFDKKRSNPASWLKKLGIAGFIFFTIKGLAWLVVLVGAVYFGLEF